MCIDPQPITLSRVFAVHWSATPVVYPNIFMRLSPLRQIHLITLALCGGISGAALGTKPKAVSVVSHRPGAVKSLFTSAHDSRE